MRSIRTIALSTGALLALPLVVFAAPQNFAQLVTLIIRLINPLVAMMTLVALAIFFWGIIKYIYAAGGGEGKNEGKSLIVWGIIALFVLVSVYALAQILVNTLNGSSNNPYPESGTVVY